MQRGRGGSGGREILFHDKESPFGVSVQCLLAGEREASRRRGDAAGHLTREKSDLVSGEIWSAVLDPSVNGAKKKREKELHECIKMSSCAYNAAL